MNVDYKIMFFFVLKYACVSDTGWHNIFLLSDEFRSLKFLIMTLTGILSAQLKVCLHCRYACNKCELSHHIPGGYCKFLCYALKERVICNR